MDTFRMSSLRQGSPEMRKPLENALPKFVCRPFIVSGNLPKCRKPNHLATRPAELDQSHPDKRDYRNVALDTKEAVYWSIMRVRDLYEDREDNRHGAFGFAFWDYCRNCY